VIGSAQDVCRVDELPPTIDYRAFGVYIYIYWFKQKKKKKKERTEKKRKERKKVRKGKERNNRWRELSACWIGSAKRSEESGWG
jgi:hypothetical protein